MIVKVDPVNRFIASFDPTSGFYCRTGILGPDGKDTGMDPFMTTYPELIDIGVMGHCIHGLSGLCSASGVQCYQSGLHVREPNMTLANYKRIIDESKGRTFQVALGGRGDVDQHEHFEELMAYTREQGIVPNFTTSGMGLTKEKARVCREYAGAVAVSWYRAQYTFRTIDRLLEAGVKTNIHFVVGNNSLEEAIDLLEHDGFPKGVNVIFLLHKPVGQGSSENVLRVDDPRVQQFYALVDRGNFLFKVGFDSCHAPGILRFMRNVDWASIDTCEAARWSMYITSSMKALPCSFDVQDQRWAYDISNDTIQNAWNSPQFEAFRNVFRNSCRSCPSHASCMGGCPVRREIVLCDKPTRLYEVLK